MSTTTSQGVTELVREMAVSFGELLRQHLRIAQLEITAELRAMVRRARSIAVLATLLAIGHALAMSGLAVLIAGQGPVGMSLFFVGLAHMGGAGLGLVVASRRVGDRPRMSVSKDEMRRSLETLGTTMAPPPESGRSPEENHGGSR